VSANITHETLKGFLDAFNRHDLDAIMDYFAEECVFYMPRGSTPRGDRYVGKTEVRAGLAKRLLAAAKPVNIPPVVSTLILIQFLRVSEVFIGCGLKF